MSTHETLAERAAALNANSKKKLQQEVRDLEELVEIGAFNDAPGDLEEAIELIATLKDNS